MELQTQVFHEINVAINEQFDFAEKLSDMLLLRSKSHQ